MNGLEIWAKFRKLRKVEKRLMLTSLVSDRLGWSCESRIMRVLTRLTFQTLRKQHELTYEYTTDEIVLSELLTELGLPSSTCLNWYHKTTKENPLVLAYGECKQSKLGTICECCIDSEVREQIKNNYAYQLASKRLYQIIVKAELFKNALRKNMQLSDDELRASLRRLVEYKYYLKRYKRRTGYKLRSTDLVVQQVLAMRNIGAMAVLKWLYTIRKHPELLRQAQEQTIEPDEIFLAPMQELKDDLGGDACN